MDAQKKRTAGKLLASCLAALALVGVATATAQAQPQAGEMKSWSGPAKSTYNEASSYYGRLKYDCTHHGGTVIRVWVHDYANNPPAKRFKAWIACQY